MTKHSIHITDLGQLPHAADRLLNSLGKKKLVALRGKMGAGKTTFIKAISKQAGVEDVVNSPTFSIVNQYETKGGDLIFHFDFYRLENETEALDIGIFDYWDSGELCFMEWPEKVEKLLPEDCVYLDIIEDETNGTRTISWEV